MNKDLRPAPKRTFSQKIMVLHGTAKQVSRSILNVVSQNRRLRGTIQPKLSVAFLELTDNCNLSCTMCIYKKMHGKTGYMSRSLFESCLSQLSQIRIETLYLHFGGESLLHPDFKEFLKSAVRYRDNGGIKNVAWIDNGMLFNKEISDIVVNLSVDSISFSVDGVGDVNDSIRLGSRYPVIQKNIKYLIERRGNATKPQVYLSMCDFGKTEEQKTDVYREWVNVVDGITLIPSIRPNNTWENKEAFCEGNRMARSPAFCPFPFDTLAISWDGKVTGCCLDYVFTLNLGDATKESIEDIWKGPKFRDFRKGVLANSFAVGSPCSACEFWQINFKAKEEIILDGAAKISYGYIYRKIQRKTASS